jgi:glycosyltransferase involved in cell wall biosynthesis
MTQSCTARPLISIGMPVYNCAATIAQAISSILNQTLTDWELLVIDDGSTDASGQIAASFNDSRIVVRKETENKCLPVRLNECVRMARGKFFARMDGDDIAYPRRLQCQLEYLQSHAEVDLVGGWVVVFRSDGTPFGTRRGPLSHQQICAHRWSGFPLPHPTWMGETEWFRRNQYSASATRNQDQELLFRTSQRSRFANAPEIVLGYREDGLSLSKILLARLDMCKMMIRACGDLRVLPTAVVGILSLAAKGLMDSIAIGTGLRYHLLRHRAPAIGLDDASQWRRVWEQVERVSRDVQENRICFVGDSISRAS